MKISGWKYSMYCHSMKLFIKEMWKVLEMELYNIYKKKLYFEKYNFSLIHGDSLDILRDFEDESIDMIFADPPYFLSNGGVTCSSGKMVLVDKATWDKKGNINDVFKFNYEWIKECKRILKNDGTIWISGTFHNIYTVGFALQQLEFKILNNITWYKNNAPPNLSCRFFTHSSEQIIWARKSKKSKHYFDYHLMKSLNDNKQMRDLWNFNTTKKSEKKYGKHPTQKPLNLLERIIISSTKPGMIILDPFSGSGTTGVKAVELERNYIGIDIEKEYLDLSIKRYNEVELDKKEQ